VRGRTLPVRVEIRGRTGELVKSVAVPGAEPKPVAAAWWRGRRPAATGAAPDLVAVVPAAAASLSNTV
jgi:hypothetical protein